MNKKDHVGGQITHPTDMIRRIAALILLQPELNKNYQAVKSDTWKWQRG